MAKKEKIEKSEISWTFPEFEQHERSRKWWIWFVVVDIIVLLFAILSANFLFALIIIMITGIIVFRHYHDPETVTCTITDEGIEVTDYAYFGNDDGASEAFPCYDEEKCEEIDRQYLNIGGC